MSKGIKQQTLTLFFFSNKTNLSETKILGSVCNGLQRGVLLAHKRGEVALNLSHRVSVAEIGPKRLGIVIQSAGRLVGVVDVFLEEANEHGGDLQGEEEFYFELDFY